MKKNILWVIIGVAVLAAALVLFKPTKSLPAQAGLPDAVAAKREAIYQAAKSRDFELLSALIGSPFRYSFGDQADREFADFLGTADENLEKQESKQKSNFDIIRKILAMPYARQEDIYVWPSVFAKGAAEWTEEDIAQMRELFSDAMIESYRNFGGYAYWRLGINGSGDWVYYIAGD